MNKRRFRIFVYKTSQHFYAQLIDNNGDVKASSSTLSLKNGKKKIGEKININFVNKQFISDVASDFAEKMKNVVIDNIAANESSFYDRGKKKYCGLVKLFADCLREKGVLI